MKSYLAAAIQMTSVPDLQKNLAQAEELIDLAVRQGAELVGLPENFSFMGEEKDKLAQGNDIYLMSMSLMVIPIKNQVPSWLDRNYLLFILPLNWGK